MEPFKRKNPPSGYWWLSFVHKAPEGDEFKGVVIAKGDDFHPALLWAWEKGLDPGGECKGAPIPRRMLSNVPTGFRGRLLDKTEADALTILLDKKHPASPPEEAGVHSWQECNPRNQNNCRLQQTPKEEAMKTLGNVMVVGLDSTTGAMSQIEMPMQVGFDYVDMHRVVPAGIESWGEERVRDVLDLVARGDEGPRAWRTAMILLAHHRSELARDLLWEVKDRVPHDQVHFWQIAVCEAESWLEGRAPFSTPDDGVLIHRHLEVPDGS